jgi:hypothetical protein
LFSDDLACDLRDEYRNLLEDGLPDEAAMRRVVDGYTDTGTGTGTNTDTDTGTGTGTDTHEAAVIWLALAVTQSRLGRLDPTVCSRALDVIDSGTALMPWEGSGHAARRRIVLQKVHDQLTGPQPARKVVRPPRRPATDLRAGEVLGYRGRTGGGSGFRWVLLRVACIDAQRHSIAPVLVAMDYDGEAVPPPEQIDRLADRPATPFRLDGSPLPAWSSTAWRVTVHGKVDHAQAGFHRLGATMARAGDASYTPTAYTSWTNLSTELESNLAGRRPTADPQ